MITVIAVVKEPNALIKAVSFMFLSKTSGIAMIAHDTIVHGSAPMAPGVFLHNSWRLAPDNTMYKTGTPRRSHALKKKVIQPPIAPNDAVATSL